MTPDGCIEVAQHAHRILIPLAVGVTVLAIFGVVLLILAHRTPEDRWDEYGDGGSE